MSEVSIRVVGRFRPINNRERIEQKKLGWSDEDVNPFEIRGENTAIEIIPAPKEGRPEPVLFTVDQVLWNVSQIAAFEAIALPVVQDTLRGFNGTIFAYGQTGSGKTFSIFGPELPPEKMMEESCLKLMGLIPRSTFWLFEQLSSHPKVRKFEVKVSALEIYVGNQLRDLLHPQTKNLKARDGPKGVFIQGLQPEVVTSVADVLQLIEIANSHRTVSATKMNATSSRSHSIFSLIVNMEYIEGGKKQARLNFADLAGSEKVGKTGAKGHKLKEGAAINSSLTVLGRVIQALAKKELAPFRESNLTYCLKDSLSGNTKTTLLVCLSPHKYNVMETMSTLQFASRAKLIKNKIKVNKVLTKKDLQREVKRLQKENELLKRQLRQKVTKATHMDAPEKGLPYVKLTFVSQEEPSSDTQYILRRREVQKEIREIVRTANLEGITVETDIRRSKKKAEDTSQPDMMVIAEDEPLTEHVPLVIHLLFQPNERFSGEALVEAKDTFLAEMRNIGNMFKQAEVEEGFANPENYGSSLSIAMQRKLATDLEHMELEKKELTVKYEEVLAKLKKLERSKDEQRLEEVEFTEKLNEQNKEIVELQDELTNMKQKQLSKILSSVQLPAISPSESDSLLPTPFSNTPPQSPTTEKKSPPSGLGMETIAEDESEGEEEEDDDAIVAQINPALMAMQGQKPTDSNASEPKVKFSLANVQTGRSPRKARTSFIQINGSLSPLLSPKQNEKASGFQNYNFPAPPAKGTKRSDLRRTLSVRDSFNDMSAVDTFDIQDKSLADFKIICQKLEGNACQGDLIEIRNLLKHTVNRMRILCDELEEEGKENDGYVMKMKEELQTRHKELDEAYADIELLRGALERRNLFSEDPDVVKIALESDEEGKRSEGEEEVEGAEEGQKKTLQNQAVKGKVMSQLQIKSQSLRLSVGRLGARESFADVVDLVSKKLSHLHSDYKNESEKKVEHVDLTEGKTLEISPSDGASYAVDWFDDEKDVIDWTNEDVVNFVASIDDGALNFYVEKFEESGINGEAILSFTRHDLSKDFNMDRDHIKIFFRNLASKDELVRQRLQQTKRSRQKRLRQRIADRNRGNIAFGATVVASTEYDNYIKRLHERDFGASKKMFTIFPGDLVKLEGNRVGRVLYKGRIEGKDGDYLGIELHKGEGINDGTHNKHRYFKTSDRRGVFTTSKGVSEVMNIDKLVQNIRRLQEETATPEPKPLEPEPDGDKTDDEPEKKLDSLMSFDEDEEDFDFSLSSSSDDDESQTVTFPRHNRHFSAIPTQKLSFGKKQFIPA